MVGAMACKSFQFSCRIPPRAPITSRTQLRHSTILSALGPLTGLFMGTHTKTSQLVTHPRIALARTRLTSEFRWNPKPRARKRWAYTYKAGRIHSPGRCGMLQSTPLRGPMSLSAHFRPKIGSDTKLSHPDPDPHHILGSTPPNSHKNFLVGHLSWNCSHTKSLNFGIPMKPEASESPKGLVLGRGGHIHIRHR
ncbi:hypothetical protein DVH24_031227 [Malus domestica]|uniref:Uncharacterized protein n=1 Tax=Malus domestica TaxID=3750 RepID=A0A498HF13_MALDO|nr:hypothetical protein DVH24_031227 [Malus domestica]